MSSNNYQSKLFDNLFAQYRSLNKELSDIDSDQSLSTELRAELDELKCKYRIEILSLKRTEHRINTLNSRERELTAELNSNNNTFIKVQLSYVYNAINRLIAIQEKQKIPNIKLVCEEGCMKFQISPQGYGHRGNELWVTSVQNTLGSNIIINEETQNICLLVTSRFSSIYTFGKTGNFISKHDLTFTVRNRLISFQIWQENVIVFIESFVYTYSYTTRDYNDTRLDFTPSGVECDHRNGKFYVGHSNLVSIYIYRIDLLTKMLIKDDVIRLSVRHSGPQMGAFRLAHNNIYVLFPNSPFSIQKFSMKGEHLHNIVNCKQMAGGNSFCIDSRHNIIVCNYAEDVIQIFNNEGQLVKEIGRIQTRGELNFWRSVSLDKNERIIVCDCYSIRSF